MGLWSRTCAEEQPGIAASHNSCVCYLELGESGFHRVWLTPKYTKVGLCAGTWLTSFWGQTISPHSRTSSSMNKPVALLHQHLHHRTPLLLPGTSQNLPPLCHWWQLAGDRRDTSTECPKAAQRAFSREQGAQGRDQDLCVLPATLMFIFPGWNTASSLFSLESTTPTTGWAAEQDFLPSRSHCARWAEYLESFVLSNLLFLSALDPRGHILWMPATHRAWLWRFATEIWVIKSQSYISVSKSLWRHHCSL